jgi:sterol desaturase/sphingolipid hydroxylase (fatty acid hydroxylase superfamily)
MDYEPPDTPNRHITNHSIHTIFFTKWNLAHLLGLTLLIPFGTLMLSFWSTTTTTAAWLVFCLLGFAVAERLWPYRIDWHPTRRAIGTDGLLLLTASLVDGLLRLFGLWVTQWAAVQGYSPGLASAWPLALAVPVAIVMGELGPYALHRLAHKHPWGWRWHQMHHGPMQVNVSNSVRVHPVNLTWNIASRGLLWWGLGLTPETLAWTTLFMMLQSVAVHANVRGRIGFLAYLIGSAEAHRWHHSTLKKEALNFGTTVPLWDQLLGTWHKPTGLGPSTVGLHALPKYSP